MAQDGKGDASQHVLHNLSQETLAEIRDLGFIEYNGGLKVNSSLLSVVPQD
jgi:hypothetical protein